MATSALRMRAAIGMLGDAIVMLSETIVMLSETTVMLSEAKHLRKATSPFASLRVTALQQP